jgi:hypothetical protein
MNSERSFVPLRSTQDDSPLVAAAGCFASFAPMMIFHLLPPHTLSYGLQKR